MRHIEAVHDVRHPSGVLGVRHQDTRTAAGNGVLEPGALVVAVHRDPDRPQLVARQRQENHVGAAVHVERQAVADAQAAGGETTGQFVDLAVVVGKGIALLAVEDRGLPADGRGLHGQGAAQVSPGDVFELQDVHGISG